MQAFLTIALIHLLAVISPGPDFAIIVKQSVTQKRTTIYWTALGIALGILVHVGYSLLGIGFIVAQSILLFTTIKLLGAAYLIFIGVKALFAKKQVGSVTDSLTKIENSHSPWQAVRIGFLCNALNPKVTIFFLALFTQVIDQHTPVALQLGYGLYMAFQTFAWFALLGSVLSMQLIRRHTDAFHHWTEKVMGAVLIALGLRVAFATRE